MAAVAAPIAPDGDVVISPLPPPSSSIDHGTDSDDDENSQTQTQSAESTVAPCLASTPFVVSPAESEGSVKTLRVSHSRPTTPTNERPRSNRPFPRSILVSTDPIVRVRVTPPLPAASTSSAASSETREREPSTDSESSPSSSESELQTPATDDSSRTTLASSSSSCIEAESTASGASSTRTRAATLCSTNTSPCVTFAPLPEIGPRQRKSSRPIGLAARGQMLRQRRMMMMAAQREVTYYYNDGTDPTIPGGEKVGKRVKVRPDNDKEQRDDLEDTEIAIAALGKMLGDATKTLWNRVAHSKAKNDDNPRSGAKRPKPARGFAWPGRRRAKARKDGHDSDEDSESDVEGPWSRRRDEDPMTKTIREGSDDELDEFVLAYDTIPACEEEEEEQAIARADEEMRTTVEVHLVKAAEGESED